jgi:hypothetical protein
MAIRAHVRDEYKMPNTQELSDAILGQLKGGYCLLGCCVVGRLA